MNTVTKGGVSNIHENVFIQTNVDITHGSSGGPLLNEEGEVVGITSFGDPTDDGARANINFARSILLLKELPVLNVKRIMDQEKVEAQRLCFSIFTRDKKVYNNYKFLWNKKSQYFDKLFDFAETPQCGDKGTIVLDLLPGDYSCNLVHKFSGEIINVGVFKVSSDGTNVFEVKLPDDQQTKYTPEKKEEKPKVKIAETKIGKAINKAINKVSTFDGYDNTIGLSLSSNRYTTSFGDNLILPFCFFLESRTQSAKRSLRFNYMFFYNKIATTTPAVKNYYHSFIFDYKFVVHEKNQFNFYIAPCLGLNDIVRYLDYPTYSTRRSENSFLIGPRFGIDGIVKNSNFIISCDFAPLVVTRSSYFSSMVDFNLMIGYRFKKD